MLDFNPLRNRRLSCGIVLFAESRELLLCHVTGQRHWDLPKGGIHAGESPLQAALRETCEETGLCLDGAAALDLGRHAYTAKKDLHLFAMLTERVDPRELHCDSCFVERGTGRERPEMDGFGWFGFDRVAELCTPKLAELLEAKLDLEATFGHVAGRIDRIEPGASASEGTRARTGAEPLAA
ncbi:MAG: NUDIX domain-containing protein [Caldimonas sp.]